MKDYLLKRVDMKREALLFVLVRLMQGEAAAEMRKLTFVSGIHPNLFTLLLCLFL